MKTSQYWGKIVDVPTDIDANPTRGHAKKARTRGQLLAAGFRLFAANGSGFTARDVTDEAEMSTGTFYNYFTDTDDLIDELMRQQLLEIAESTSSDPIDDPALRIATTATRILDRTIADPVWGQLVLRLVAQAREPNRMNGQLRNDLVEGFETQRFTRGADDATLDQAMGLLVMTIRRIVAGDDRTDLVPAMVARLLETLGIPPTEAAQLATSATA